MTDSSTWPSSDTAGKLCRADALAYLRRLDLAESLVDEPPSLDLLKKLQSAHLVTVPFESTSIHVKDWQDDDADVELGGGETVPLAEDGFRHIVKLRRGGYCFLLNGTFPSLLRWFGFNVSECMARVNLSRKDPELAGADWDVVSHQVSIVDWSGSGGRYLSDVGFGSGTAFPFLLRDGTEVSSIPSTDVHRLTLHDTLPFSSSLFIDQAPTWMVSRRVISDGPTASDRKYTYIPNYAFQLVSTSHRDVRAMNHFQSTCSESTFYKLFVATLLHSNGERTTLSYHAGSVDEQGSKAAKLTRSRLTTNERNDEVIATRYVPMKVAAIRGVLESEFGMSFPKDYTGNRKMRFALIRDLRAD